MADVFKRILTITAGRCVVDVHRVRDRNHRGGAYKIEAHANGAGRIHALRRVMDGYMPNAKWQGRQGFIRTRGKRAFISGDEGGASCLHWREDYASALDIAFDLAWGGGN